MKKDDYTGVLLEDIQSQIKRLAEAMADVPQDVRLLKEDMAEVKADIKVIKAVVTDHDKELNDHQKRITVLEAA
jgi:uncharacterized protein (UPF0335 family)